MQKFTTSVGVFFLIPNSNFAVCVSNSGSDYTLQFDEFWRCSCPAAKFNSTLPVRFGKSGVKFRICKHITAIEKATA